MRDEWVTDARLANALSDRTQTEVPLERVTQWRESARIRKLVGQNPDQDEEWGLTEKGERRLRRIKLKALLPAIGLALTVAGFAAGPMNADRLIVGVVLFLVFALLANVYQYSLILEALARRRATFAWKRELLGLGPPGLRAAPGAGAEPTAPPRGEPPPHMRMSP